MSTLEPGLEAAANTLNTVVLGAGDPPLIMLHGWGQSLGSLWALAELLAKSRTVHLLDLPGFGKSPRPPEDWNTEQYAYRILSFLDERKIGRADILGHSFGGRIAIRMAHLAPERLERLVLINAAGLPRRLTGKALVRQRLAKISARTCRWLDRLFALNTFQEWHVPRFASSDYKNAGELKNIFVKTVNEDLTECARHIQNPTLLLWGERDEEVPVATGNRYAQLIPSAKLVVLPGKDHFPFLNEGAHLCAYHILKFLADSGPTMAGTKQGEKVSV